MILLLSSCDIINPSEDMPVYLTVGSAAVSAGAGEGTSSHKVHDAWVYINEDLVGAFELPARIPILEKGSKRVSIQAGILDNGNSGIRKQYPYYSAYNANMNFGAEPLQVDPVFSYHSSSDFAFIDGFEIGTEFETDGGDTTLEVITDPSLVFEGTRSGAFYLDAGKEFRAKTTNAFPLPGNSNPVYLELNYNCSIHFTVGIRAFGPGGQFDDLRFGIKTKPEWNKMYLNLTDLVTGYKTTYKTTAYEILIRADGGVNGGYVYLDNIKLIF